MNPDGITRQEVIFLAVFALLEFVVPVFVVWASYSNKSRLNLTSLWVHHDRVDKLAVILMLTWWTHTSSMILWTLMQRVVTADYLTYMGWALPIIAQMFAPVAPVVHSEQPKPPGDKP